MNEEMKNRNASMSSLNEIQLTASTLTGCKAKNKDARNDTVFLFVIKFRKR